MRLGKLHRLISLTIAVLMLFGSVPASALEKSYLANLEDEEALRRAIAGLDIPAGSSVTGQAIAGDVKWLENYPNGLFNFIGGQFKVSETNEYIEIAVARQGGTDGEVSVGLKAIDITAEYGKDYVIKIFENGYKRFGGEEAVRNPDSVPLIESMSGGAEVDIGINPYGEGDSEHPGVTAETVTSQAISAGGKEKEPEKEQSYEILLKSPIAASTTSQGISLREAKEIATGIKSDRPQWRSADKNSVEALKSAYDETFGSVPGAEATLTFKGGEYIKYIYIVPVDDKISEDDELVMLMLENPTNGSARGENYMATLVIEDNESKEESTFEFVSDFAVVESNKAKATIVRKGGINRYASVVVGTVEGTAVNGGDYVDGLAELQFVPGMEEQTVTVDILENQYRTEGREFEFVLEEAEGSVNTGKAYCGVYIPAAEGALTPDEFNLKASGETSAAKAQLNLLGASSSAGGEKISQYGYSDKKGQWVIAPDDFINGMNNGGIKEGSYVKIAHTGGERWSHADKVKLYGADRLEFGFTNNGEGSYYQDYEYKWYTLWQKHWYTVNVKNYKFTFEIEAPNSPRAVKTYNGEQGWTIHRSDLSENQWNTGWIGVYSQAEHGNATNLNMYGIRLFLKKYNIKTIDAQSEKKITYELNSGELSAKSEQEYSPGQLVIENVDSHVGNTQGSDGSRRSSEAYRSDRIRLVMKYGSDNPNGKYAVYKGFRIKNGSGWINFYNSNLSQDLDLNTAFFQKSGILDTIRSGNIEIQPIFEKRAATADIEANTQLGSCTNIGSNEKSKSLKGLFIGDKIINIAAKPLAVAMTPNFSAQTGSNSQSARGNSEGINITDTLAGSIIDYTIHDSYSKISINFGKPELVVAANPSVYANRTGEPVYWIDGVSYTNHEEFSKKMLQAYNENQNPTIKMQFEYVFDDAYIENKAEAELRKSMFGYPASAVLTVYKSDGTQRETRNIVPQEGKFAVEGKLKDLGWAIDDYASVSITGSEEINGQKVQTRETVVNFLYNTANGVIVKNPDGSTVGSAVGRPVKVAGASPVEEYGLSAYTSGNFITKWADYSVDSDGDGFESDDEQKTALARLRALGYSGTLDDVRRSNIYYGNEFFMKPQFFDPTKILYNFEKRPMEASNSKIGFKLVQTGGTVLYPEIQQAPQPIKNLTVILAGKEIQPYNDEGMYLDMDPLYMERGYYLGKVFIDPYEYCFEVQQGIQNEVKINTSEIMPPVNFTAQVGGKVVDFNETHDYLDIEDKITEFSYGFDNSKTGITPNSSKIRIYNEKKEVVQTFVTGLPDGEGKFTYLVNLLNAGVKPGYTMSIVGVFTEGKTVQEFPEVPVGLTLSRKLTAITVAASFKTPLQPVINLIGKINTAYDLGMDINLEDKMTKLDSYTDSEGRERLPLVVSFGFDKKFEKKFGEEAQKKAEGKQDQDKTFAEEKVGSDFNKETVKGNQAEGAVQRGSGEGSASLDLNISLSVILEKMGGETYFNSVVIMATADAQAGYSYTYVTPIGIPVTASVAAEGKAVAALGMESHIAKPFDEQYRFDGEGKISFNPKNYASYFKFEVTPSIELSAGAGFTYLNLSISGRGDFDFKFDVPIYGENLSSSGSGGLKMSAALSIKVLFIQKRWTLYQSENISLFSYNRANLLSNPYQDYMYESLGGTGEDDIMSREYLENKSGWMGEASRRMLMSNAQEEKTLITSAYPYPQTKLVKLDDYSTMMLFIDDDSSRDDYNRAVLKYSIGRDGSWSSPVSVDDDGTWDESPNAFVVNGKVFIVWSNAARRFTYEDTEISMLKAMDIKARWYNPETGALSGETIEITRTIPTTASAIGGKIKEECADLDPMIAFDEDTGRLMIYYTKIDYDDSAREEGSVDLSATETIPPEDGKLYGDIVNGYNVIAYRYADLQKVEFIWNEEYEPYEGFTPELAEQYYGQRFLNLAVPAAIEESIKREIVTTPIAPEDDIYGLGFVTEITESVRQRAVYDKDNPADPRVVDADLISYNGLALYAYAIDFDANLKTVDDQKIYLQIYNFEEGSFTHPILLTNEDVQNTMPRFVRSKGLTYMYWLSDGEVAYMDISTLVQCGLKETEVEGAPQGTAGKIYVIDKEKAGMSEVRKIAVAKEDDNPIGEFQIGSDGEGIYLVWPQFKTRTKEGSGEVIREKQIFAAYSSPKQQRTNAEEPQNQGENPGETGGKSQLISGEGYDWSKPVQVTFGEGASYSNISFILTEEDNLRISYIKYEQVTGEDGIPIDSELNRVLGITDIQTSSHIEFSGMILPERISGNEAKTKISLKNTGAKPAAGIEYQTYIKAGGVEDIVEDWKAAEDSSGSGSILGGNTVTISSYYPLPEGEEGIRLGIRFRDESDAVIKDAQLDIEMDSTVEATVLKSELLSAHAANIILNAKNTGNASFGGKLSVKNNETYLYSEDISLAPGESRNFNLKVNISGGEFTETKENQEGGLYDTLTLTVEIGDTKADAGITRSAGKEIADALDNIKTFGLSFGGKLLDENSVISTRRGSIEKLDVDYKLKNKYDETLGEADPYEVVFKSEDENVISLLRGGTFTMDRNGSATVTAVLKPVNTLVEAGQGSYNVVDTSYLYPAGVIKTKSVRIKASSGGSGTVPSAESGPTLQADDGIVKITSEELREKSNITVETGGASVTFDKNAITKIAESGKDVEFKLKPEDGNKFIISVTVDGKEITDLGKGKISGKLPYSLEAGQEGDNVVLYRISDGRSVCLPFAYLNDGKISFESGVLGTFEIKYNKIGFIDVSVGDWFYKAVSYASARGVIKGVGNNMFAPNSSVKRADFLIMAMRTFGMDSFAGYGENFADVGNTYYTAYLADAKARGIVNGIGGNKFAPEAEISREDMFVILYNIMKKLDVLEEVTENEPIFTDGDSISEYAREAVYYLAALKIVNGYGGQINPKGTALRSETAQIMYNIMSK